MTWDDSIGVLVLTGVDGRISFWSAAAEERFGWTVSETAGRPLHDFTETSAGDTVLGELPKQELNQPLENECRVRHKSGSSAEVWLHTSPLRDGTGRLHGYLQVFRELSEGKHAERAALSQANTNVVPVPRPLLHNLNNLVTSIHSTLELALRGELPPVTVAFLSQAQSSARMVVQMVNSFRSIGREAATAPVASQPGNANSSAPVPRPSETQNLEGHERILLVEDDSGIRMLMRAVLGYRGYQVTDAANGNEAVSRMDEAEQPFDLAILDVHMPGLNGLEVLARLRSKWSDIRALFVTGNLDQVTEAGDFGPNVAFLGKPFQNIELLQAVRQALDRSAARVTAQE